MIAWTIDTLVATALLMAVVLLVRIPVTRWFGPRVAYALWLLPAARFFMPAITRTIEVSVPAAPADPALTLSREQLAALAESTGPADPDWTVAVITAWLAGAALLFLWRIGDHLRECEEILEESQHIGTENGIRLVQSYGLTGPVAFGIFRKCIAVPPSFYRDYSERERELALAHEHAHHRSNDLLINFAAFSVLCLHWFNPVAWLAWRAFRFDQEAACDARVLARTDPADRPLYGRTIVKASSGRALLFASALDNPNSLKKRLRTMAMNDQSRFRRIAGWTAIGVGLAVALPMTATVSYAVVQVSEEPVTEAVEDRDRERRPIRVVRGEEGEGRVVRIVRDTDDEHGDRTRHRGYVGDYPTREELEAMIPSHEELIAMLPSEAELAAMIPSETELREMIPSEAELREMVPDREELIAAIPDIETIEQCHESGEAVHSEESTDPATGRERLRLMICRERLANDVRVDTLESLRQARDQVSADGEIPATVRADVLAVLDERIGRLSR
ncbi:MAG: M56 family metallopeptidase [Pseudomonadota bacterium]